jgi:hypothetical protein
MADNTRLAFNPSGNRQALLPYYHGRKPAYFANPNGKQNVASLHFACRALVWRPKAPLSFSQQQALRRSNIWING